MEKVQLPRMTKESYESGLRSGTMCPSSRNQITKIFSCCLAESFDTIKSIAILTLLEKKIYWQSQIQVNNYTVNHIKGAKNHLADVLSRRPVWLNADHTLRPDEGLDLEDGEHLP